MVKVYREKSSSSDGVAVSGCRCGILPIFRLGKRRRDDDAETIQHPTVVRLLCLGSACGAQDTAGAVEGSTSEDFHFPRVRVGCIARI